MLSKKICDIQIISLSSIFCFKTHQRPVSLLPKQLLFYKVFSIVFVLWLHCRSEPRQQLEAVETCTVVRVWLWKLLPVFLERLSEAWLSPLVLQNSTSLWQLLLRDFSQDHLNCFGNGLNLYRQKRSGLVWVHQSSPSLKSCQSATIGFGSRDKETWY